MKNPPIYQWGVSRAAEERLRVRRGTGVSGDRRGRKVRRVLYCNRERVESSVPGVYEETVPDWVTGDTGN